MEDLIFRVSCALLRENWSASVAALRGQVGMWLKKLSLSHDQKGTQAVRGIA